MTQDRFGKAPLVALGFLLVSIFIIGGCAQGPFATKATPGVTTAAMTTQSMAAPAPSYLDFGDVLVPREFKVNKKKTYMVKTTGFVTGILSLKGRVDVPSLVNFYKLNMPKDGWGFITSFESPEKTVMLFQKAERWAVINITGDVIYTYLEIAVAPSMKEAASGLMMN